MQISLHEVEGQVLRVGVRHGDAARPPLVLFNGIGANIELLEPFLDALDGPPAIVFDVPGVGGSCYPEIIRRGHGRFLVYNYTSPLDGSDPPWGTALPDSDTLIYRMTLTFPSFG